MEIREGDRSKVFDERGKAQAADQVVGLYRKHHVPERVKGRHNLTCTFPERLDVDAQIDLVGGARRLTLNGADLHLRLLLGSPCKRDHQEVTAKPPEPVARPVEIIDGEDEG